ncbi:centromere-binding protein CNN1 NDAI_0B06250 [Naumovozyma dairenensis CBS 421]|uniref:Uncharacterized protein n=1 Tax=Naumovozyma dairenensis (strain ATCC 10597 / BCRC 20456 / CBS 421 / NBRC 0211 / NRRL Y-12639) TaxID=1071378 RepID=G0W795_NAUDC|nr:hypothetical protein NDAI_0B06250 [Naumovozyma dairenensis CBS 421]CCD23656.1 hypothetical protein NDAI_0B06250 [Naumovozyma dairenensis CBS 421]
MSTPRKYNDALSDNNSEIITPFKERALEEQRIKEQLLLSATPGLRRRLEIQSTFEPLATDPNEIKSYLRDLSSALLSQGKNLTKLLNEEVVSIDDKSSGGELGIEQERVLSRLPSNVTDSEAKELHNIQAGQILRSDSTSELGHQEPVDNKLFEMEKKQSLEGNQITPLKRSLEEKKTSTLSEAVFSQLREVPSRPKIRKIKPVFIEGLEVSSIQEANSDIEKQTEIEEAKNSATIHADNDNKKDASKVDKILSNEEDRPSNDFLVEHHNESIVQNDQIMDNDDNMNYNDNRLSSPEPIGIEPSPFVDSYAIKQPVFPQSEFKIPKNNFLNNSVPNPSLSRKLSNNIPKLTYDKYSAIPWSNKNDSKSDIFEDTNMSIEKKLIENQIPMGALSINELQETFSNFLEKENIKLKPYTWTALQGISQQVLRRLIKIFRDDRNSLVVNFESMKEILYKYGIISPNATNDDIFDILCDYLPLEGLNEIEMMLFQ